jgi:DNA-binding MarR family transcriptional regulator
MTRRRDNIGFMLWDVARQMRRNFKRRLNDSCLTHAQARVLVHAARNEGIRQIELADMLEVQPITLAPVLDRLA